MADLTTTKFIDLTGLTEFKSKMVTYIGTEDAKSLKTMVLGTGTDANKIYFYKKESPTVGTDTPDYTIDLSGIYSDVATIKGDNTTEGSIKKAVKDLQDTLATVATSGKAADVSIEDTAGKITATTVEGALAELAAAIGSGGSVESQIQAAIEDLDGSVTGTGNFVKTISETDGKITATLGGIAVDDVPTLTLSKISDAGTAAAKAAATAAIADDTTDTSLVSSEQVATYVKAKVAGLTGAMHFTYSVTPTGTQTDVQAIEAAYTAASATPAKGDFVVITTNSKEYVYDGSAWVELGDESLYVTKATTIAGVDLQDNITKSELLTALNVADGAQVNVIEGVQVNGSDLTPDANKKVNVTVAEGATDGTVAVNGTDVAVHGLGSAAYTASTAYATAAQGTKADSAVQAADITLATNAEIDDLFK